MFSFFCPLAARQVSKNFCTIKGFFTTIITEKGINCHTALYLREKCQEKTRGLLVRKKRWLADL